MRGVQKAEVDPHRDEQMDLIMVVAQGQGVEAPSKKTARGMEMLEVEVEAPLKRTDEIIVSAQLLEMTRMVGRMITTTTTMKLLLEVVNDW